MPTSPRPLENPTASLKREAASAGRFALVGLAATATHAGVALIALESIGLGPYAANVAGFVLAFTVSFSGHHFWSFAHTHEAGQTARRMARFFLIALGGFGLNSGVLTGWLQLTNWPESIGLIVSIAIVPALSFLFARLWAFRAPAEKGVLPE